MVLSERKSEIRISSVHSVESDEFECYYVDHREPGRWITSQYKSTRDIARYVLFQACILNEEEPLKLVELCSGPWPLTKTVSRGCRYSEKPTREFERELQDLLEDSDLIAEAKNREISKITNVIYELPDGSRFHYKLV